jgi:tRNA-2-methylthio-N6-dimethylallyladenosine synthase
MLAAVAEVPGVRRVRYTTSHPRDFTREIVEAMETYPAICNHVHLPVQSGSTRLLKGMLREYTREEYLTRIAWIREASPRIRRPISITTDIIVGFPGETEEDFEQTVTLLEEVGYDSIFSFQYSPRPNTAALTLDDAIPDAEKGKRLRILQDRQRQIQAERYERFVGAECEVLVEGASSRAADNGSAQWKGRTTENLILNFTVPEKPAENLHPGSYWRVRVTRTTPNCLIGEALGGPTLAPPLDRQEGLRSTGTPFTDPRETGGTASSAGPFRIL